MAARRARLGGVVLALLLAPGCDGPVADAPAVDRLTAEALLDPESCRPCHPDQVAEWQHSMHAYGADSPVFRAMAALAAAEAGVDAVAGCLGCHAPLAVRTGAWTPAAGVAGIEALPRSLRGVTCAFCHTVDAVEGDHGNPLRLDLEGPLRGGIVDPRPSAAHASVGSPLHGGRSIDSASLCGACHDVVNRAGLHLERSYDEWRSSIFAEPDAGIGLTCSQCHMPGRDAPASRGPEPGPTRRIHDHLMPGVDVHLGPHEGAEGQRAAVEEALVGAVGLKLCVVEAGGEGASLVAAMTNLGAGHAIPSGAAHYRRLWLEVRAIDAAGEVLLDHTVPPDVPAVDLEPTGLWLLRERLYDAEGRPVLGTWGALESEPRLLPPPQTLSPGQHLDGTALRRYVLAAPPARIEVQARLRPMGLDVMDQLEAHGLLDAAVRARAATFTLPGTALEWTREAARLDIAPGYEAEALCVGLR